MTIPSTVPEVQAAIAAYLVNMQRFADLVNGPASGAGSTVTLDEGETKTWRRIIDEAQTAFSDAVAGLDVFYESAIGEESVLRETADTALSNALAALSVIVNDKADSSTLTSLSESLGSLAGKNSVALADLAAEVTSLINSKVTQSAIDQAILDIKGTPSSAGDTLQKLDAGKANIDDVILAPYMKGQPGELLLGYSSVLSGQVSQRTTVLGTTGYSITDHPNMGRSVVMTNIASFLSHRAATPIYPGHVYEFEARFARQTNPQDPFSDAVEYGVQWLTYTKSEVSGENGRITLGSLPLRVSDGIKHFGRGQPTHVRFSLDVSGVDHIIPPSARYGVAFIKTFGTDHATVIGHIDLVDVTEQFQTEKILAATTNQLAILNFVADISVFETGDQQNVEVTWTTSGYFDVISQAIRINSGSLIAIGADAVAFQVPNVSTTTTVELVVTDSNGATQSDRLTIEVLPKFYSGVSQNATLDNAQILALTNSDFVRTLTYEATFDCSVNGGNNFIHYLFPASLGQVQAFKIFGSNISLSEDGVISTIDVINSQGVEISYTHVRSPNALNSANAPIEVI